VYGFDVMTGSRLYTWQHLSQYALTSIVWTKQQQLITASREATAAVSDGGTALCSTQLQHAVS
jgi:hypothetical protein